MSNHNNINTQESLQPTKNAYAWYNEDRDSFLDIISPPSRLFPHILNERVDIDPWLWSLEDRIFTLPSSIMRCKNFQFPTTSNASCGVAKQFGKPHEFEVKTNESITNTNTNTDTNT
ncbi:unnamed protein product [Lactuca saligna]|uniref:Uncharacterized protein n=1 Tax=Lactuca saligna TaxID=75948 RepID=A0AA36E214_LACSI|nr:unnamed protein product [Lactuca saligna]